MGRRLAWEIAIDTLGLWSCNFRCYVYITAFLYAKDSLKPNTHLAGSLASVHTKKPKTHPLSLASSYELITSHYTTG